MVEQNTIRNGASLGDTLQAAVLCTFSAIPNEEVGNRLGRFGVSDWRGLGTWLHASGLALYFLEEIRIRGLFGALPGTVLEGLLQNQLDNRDRTDSLMREFERLNVAFHGEGFDYLNVKGFSLGSEYCGNPTLRSQFDLDFWIREDHSAACKALMNRLGYEVAAATAATLEFRTRGAVYPKIRDFYKPRRHHSVEIHLRSSEEMAGLPRQNGLLHSFVFPTLSREQAFIQQACHLTKHLRSEWTRASWMLELHNAIDDGYHDVAFWQSVRAQSSSAGTAILIGIAVLASAKVFRFAIPPELGDWTVDALPENVARWVNEYAAHAVAAQFPGSKLYLLLERELAKDTAEYLRRRRSVLLPLRLPGDIATTAGTGARGRALIPHARYVGFRLAFHLREGLRLLRAERDWIRRVDTASRCVVKDGRSIA